MKNSLYILAVVVGIITSFFVWIYTQRNKMDYNAEGSYFSAEDGLVYHEQAKDIYGLLALFGLMLTGVLLFILLRKRKS